MRERIFTWRYPYWREAAHTHCGHSDFESYLKCLHLLLCIYNERKDVEKINEINEELESLLFKQDLHLNSQVCYTLALCAMYSGENQIAFKYFERSLAMALHQDKKEDICHAITGLAMAYMELDCLKEALREIHNLRVFFEVLDLPDVRLMSELMNGRILCRMGEDEQALKVFGKCYENLSVQKNLYIYIQLLYATGMAYSGTGDTKQAHSYLLLAKKLIDPHNLVRLDHLVCQTLESFREESQGNFDLVFEEPLGLLIEKYKGQVSFKNQFVLLDMLKLFLNSPGETHSKRDLAHRVWKQSYDPRVHDNKIYVTIKRLRKMIEPDYNRPRYIFRSKNGYYLNKSVKVHWRH